MAEQRESLLLIHLYWRVYTAAPKWRKGQYDVQNRHQKSFSKQKRVLDSREIR